MLTHHFALIQRSTLICLIILIGPLAWSQSGQKRYFTVGEKLNYSINYGWFKLGEGEAIVEEVNNSINGKDHLSVDLRAKTVGFLSFVKNVEAHFHSYLDHDSYKPTYSEKQVLEGKETWDQTNFFNYETMTVDVSAYTNKKDPPKRHWLVDLETNTFDILGTYMYLRNIPWGKLAIGDSIMLGTLYEKKVYEFGVERGPIEKVEFQGKMHNAYKLYVLFPISKTFPEEKAVMFWVIEHNGVHIPVLIEANMRIGKVICKIEGYERSPSP